MSLLVSSSIGLIAGLFAGVLGIGGGVIMIPGMVFLLGAEQHLAQGVSLAVVAATATVGAFEHYKLGNVKLDRAVWMGPAAAIFGFLGAWIAGSMDEMLLQRIFAVLLLVMGGRMVLGK